LSYFGSSGKRRYREFVVEGMKSGIKTPWEEIRGQVVIGSEEFVEEAARKHVRGQNNQRSEESRLREIVGVKPDALLGEVKRYFGINDDEIRSRKQRYEARYVACLLLRWYCLMRLWEIGGKVGLHYSAVGNAIRQIRERPTDSQAKSLKDMEAKFKNR
jgi:chromosomal replication initiation ATPase DnaA